MIATDEGFRAGAMLAHRARLSTTEGVKLVRARSTAPSPVPPQAAMVKSIEATVYIDRIRELAGGITTSRPGRGRGPKPRPGSRASNKDQRMRSCDAGTVELLPGRGCLGCASARPRFHSRGITDPAK